MRNRTGNGLRHPSLIAAARDASTGIYGLPFRILMVAVKAVLMGIELRSVPAQRTYAPSRLIARVTTPAPSTERPQRLARRVVFGSVPATRRAARQ